MMSLVGTALDRKTYLLVQKSNYADTEASKDEWMHLGHSHRGEHGVSKAQAKCPRDARQ